ncbi:MAG: hypothetical protein ACE5H9_13860 [Anaerolineae bacterium]
MRQKLRSVNLWFGMVLLAGNLLAWTTVLAAQNPPYVVEPVRDEEVEQLLAYIRSGDHGGETWQVTLTELEAEQTITWYLNRYPHIPFEHPRVVITPDYVGGEGDATIAGLRVHVGGKARITLRDGLPLVEILELTLPVPGPIREQLEAEIQRQLKRADRLPVTFEEAEFGAGVVVVRGRIK